MPSTPKARISPKSPFPPFELPIPLHGRQHAVLPKPNTELINGHCHMLILVRVDPDDDLDPTTPIIVDHCGHLDLLL